MFVFARPSIVNQSHRNEEAEVGANPNASAIKVAILVDQTGSMTWSNTSPVTAGSLRPLIDRLRESSGELGLGLIRDRSQLGLVRLRVDLAPVISAAPKRGGSPFADERALRQFRKTADQERKRRAEWEEETDRRVKQFLAQVRPLLDRHSDARCTSIWEAVARADAYLAEDEPDWPKGFARWACLISDGQHNCGPTLAVPPRSGAEWLLVHGAGAIGKLDAIRPRPFESF